MLRLFISDSISGRCTTFNTILNVIICSFLSLGRPLETISIFVSDEFAKELLFPSQVSCWLDRSQMRPMSDISRLCERLLSKAVAVSVQRRLGWHVLQPGPELLHQSRSVQERRHVLQHGRRIVHMFVPTRFHRTRVQSRPGTDQQTRTGLFNGTDVLERRNVQGKCLNGAKKTA